jgi:prevent-host-death family protein
MSSISAGEAEAHFGELLDRVAKGEEFVITRHDRPVARVIPETEQTLTDTKEAVGGLRRLQGRIKLNSNCKDSVTDADVLEAIDQGRM